MGSSKLYVAPLGADPDDRSQWIEVGLLTEAEAADFWADIEAVKETPVFTSTKPITGTLLPIEGWVDGA